MQKYVGRKRAHRVREGLAIEDVADDRLSADRGQRSAFSSDLVIAPTV